MNRRTIKLMTIYNGLHPRADVHRLCNSRKERGTAGLANIQDSVNVEEQSLSTYIDTSEEEMLTVAKEENVPI